MHKKLNLLLFSSIFLFIFLVSGCGGGRNRSKVSYKRTDWTIKKLDSRSNVKLVRNKRVQAWLDYFRGPGRARFGRYLKRSGRYAPLMKGILKDHGLPEDIIHIALIESGFTSGARSHANAVGFWQFIRSTGKHYNLRIDSFIDERMDPVKSTHAAANYLVDLYKLFGDWHLAFAGYNAGEGKVGRAIKKYGTKNFWKLSSKRRRYLRPETKDYVPKFIAATILAKNPRKHGFKIDYHEPIEYDLVKVSSQTDVETIAKCSRSDYSEIVALNTELLMGVTPPGERNYEIKVPRGKGKKFLSAFARLPKSKRLTRVVRASPAKSRSRYHVVKRGETASKIARKHGVSTKSLLSANRIKNARRLRKGQRLKIPGRVSKKKYSVSRPSSDRIQIAQKKTTKKTTRKLTHYRVKRGDTLSVIANRHGVTVANLKRWNKIKGTGIVAGKKLKIYKGGEAPGIKTTRSSEIQLADASVTNKVSTRAVKYKVKKGDTLGAVARKHKVSIKQLKKWNNLKNNNIYVGKHIIVRKEKVSGSAPLSSRSVVSSKSYKVRKGDSWWSIAKKHNLTVASLKKLNPKVGKVLKIGRKINLASSSKRASAKAQSVGSSATYKVRSGDTLYTIARRNSISISELCRLNNISRSAVLKLGMKLRFKKEVSGPALAVSAKNASSDRLMLSNTPSVHSKKPLNYKVKSGDTAWGIAKKHNVSISQIKVWNGGTDLSKLKPGDVIRLKFASKKNM